MLIVLFENDFETCYLAGNESAVLIKPGPAICFAGYLCKDAGLTHKKLFKPRPSLYKTGSFKIFDQDE